MRQPRYGDRKSGLPDRRASHRFPLRFAIKYRPTGMGVAAHWVFSESVDISSGGVFFRTAETVAPGQSLEAWVAWPILLDKHIPLRLVTKGLVVRNDGIGAAMRFETFEFRTGQVQAEASRVVPGFRPNTHASGGQAA